MADISAFFLFDAINSNEVTTDFIGELVERKFNSLGRYPYFRYNISISLQLSV